MRRLWHELFGHPPDQVVSRYDRRGELQASTCDCGSPTWFYTEFTKTHENHDSSEDKGASPEMVENFAKLETLEYGSGGVRPLRPQGGITRIDTPIVFTSFGLNADEAREEARTLMLGIKMQLETRFVIAVVGNPEEVGPVGDPDV